MPVMALSGRFGRAVQGASSSRSTCAALAARIAAVQVGSSWTNIFGRSSVDGTARWWTATPNCNRARSSSRRT